MWICEKKVELENCCQKMSQKFDPQKMVEKVKAENFRVEISSWKANQFSFFFKFKIDQIFLTRKQKLWSSDRALSSGTGSIPVQC